MTLDRVKRGQSFTIKAIPDANVRAQAIRLGMAGGSPVVCEEVIPAGPVVIRCNRQLIALGRGLARRINIDLT